MRTESLWQKQQRAARRHWWRQVLGTAEAASWEEIFDEVVALRFVVGEQAGSLATGGDLPGTSR